MNGRMLISGLCLSVLGLVASSPARALNNRVFVSARSGNDANTCDDVNAPCKTFAGAVTKLNPSGEAIALDSGGYGPVTITQAVTIEAPAGVTAFIHPSSGDAITVTTGSSDTVTLRGLTLNVGAGNGIMVNSVGTLNVENCFITGFVPNGILMISAGHLNLKGTDIKACGYGVVLASTTGPIQASIDHCHFDGNFSYGYIAATTSPGSSATSASNSTANSNSAIGWLCGNGSSGKDVLNLEFSTGAANGDGLAGNSSNPQSVARYSNCVFANNQFFGVARLGSEIVESRGNNTITGNGTAPTFGTIGTFPPM